MARQSTPPSDDLHRCGEPIGRWRLVRCIGSGGMGSVWEAHHESLKRRVAIKFIHAARVNDEETRMRFVTEAKAAASLQSRHVVEILDHGVTDRGDPFIVMEYLSGESLEDRLQREGRLGLDVTATIVVQVSRALQQAHDVGIIHRDLKPENIFLVPDHEAGPFTAKILDFGVAKVSGLSADLADARTKTGMLMGTPYYMAPEQAKGAKDICPQSDIWSLGVIAYRCMTGQLPFEGHALGELLVNICVGAYPAATSVIAGLPPGVDGVLAAALDLDPARRFARVQDFARALADVASDGGSLHHTFNPVVTPASPFSVPAPRWVGAPGVDPLAATRASMPPSTKSPVSDWPKIQDNSPSIRHSASASGPRLSVILFALATCVALGGAFWRIHVSRNGLAPSGPSGVASAPPRAPSPAPESADGNQLQSAPKSEEPPTLPEPAVRAPNPVVPQPQDKRAPAPPRAKREVSSSADPGF